MELTISVDLAQLNFRVRRPYFGAWTEDAEKFPVRTMALWFQRDRWLPELRAWYRTGGTEIASATLDYHKSTR
jgi:FAD:protein FMN transferase